MKVGSNNKYQPDSPYEQDIGVSGIFIHPNYSGKSSLAWNIALLKLSSDVQFPFNDRINVVCLPIANSWPTDGIYSVIVGWGNIKGMHSVVCGKGRERGNGKGEGGRRGTRRKKGDEGEGARKNGARRKGAGRNGEESLRTQDPIRIHFWCDFQLQSNRSESA